MAVTTVEYPMPGSAASRALTFIEANPGTSRNGLIVGLQMNPGVARKVTQALVARGLVVDDPDDSGYHRYTIAEDSK